MQMGNQRGGPRRVEHLHGRDELEGARRYDSEVVVEQRDL
jgi:hypothetical protein